MLWGGQELCWKSTQAEEGEGHVSKQCMLGSGSGSLHGPSLRGAQAVRWAPRGLNEGDEIWSQVKCPKKQGKKVMRERRRREIEGVVGH